MTQAPLSSIDTRRRGVTLLELLVVVSLMGIFSTVIVSRYGRSTVGDIGSQGDTHRLWLDMQYARRLAIKNGQSCCIAFTSSGTATTGYRLLLGTSAEVGSGTATQVDQSRVFGSGLQAAPNSTVFEFDFEGHGLANYSVILTAPDQRWSVQVVPLSGIATVMKL